MIYDRTPAGFHAGVLIGCLLLVTAPGPTTGDDTHTYRAAIEEWHRNRAESLTAEGGWLSLIGLFWLDEGVNTVGSDPDSDVALPSPEAPSRVGTLILRGDRVHLEVAEDVGDSSIASP